MSLFAATLARTLGQAAAHGVGGIASLTPNGAPSPTPRRAPQRGGPPPCTPCAAAQMVRDAQKKYGVR